MGRPLLVAASVVVMAGCSARSGIETTASPASAPAASPTQATTRTVYVCGNSRATLGRTARGVYLLVDGSRYAMQGVASQSGERFAALGDPSTTFWVMGDLAALVERGNARPECRKAG